MLIFFPSHSNRLVPTKDTGSYLISFQPAGSYDTVDIGTGNGTINNRYRCDTIRYGICFGRLFFMWKGGLEGGIKLNQWVSYDRFRPAVNSVSFQLCVYKFPTICQQPLRWLGTAVCTAEIPYLRKLILQRRIKFCCRYLFALNTFLPSISNALTDLYFTILMILTEFGSLHEFEGTLSRDFSLPIFCVTSLGPNRHALRLFTISRILAFVCYSYS